MKDKIEGIKTRNFGIEIEMTGLTRKAAAEAVGRLFGTDSVEYDRYYGKYSVMDEKGRIWQFVYDSSIHCIDEHGNSANSSHSVELNSPVLGYEDIPLLQEVIRTLRRAGGICSPEYQCGTHIHISADDFTPQQIRNLVNIFASKEDYLWDALQVSSARESYCQKCDPKFVEQLNQKKPKTMEEIEKLWYKGDMDELYEHYSRNRYRALNLHSFFQHGHYEIRCCNGSLHAGEIRSQIVLALAINEEICKIPALEYSEEELVERAYNDMQTKELKKAFQKLDEEERQLIIMYYYLEMTQEEIAKSIGKTQQAVSYNISAILNKLHKLLKI